jgi:hypothetical protein
VGWRPCSPFREGKEILCLLLEGSKPTAWDGDGARQPFHTRKGRSSRPTAWDDDTSTPNRVLNTCAVDCSKPTVWDGDIRKLRKRLTKVYSFFCSKPTAWDGDREREEPEGREVPSPQCGMVMNLADGS